MNPNLRLRRGTESRPRILLSNSSSRVAVFALQTTLLISPGLAVGQSATGSGSEVRPLGTLLYTLDERKALQPKPQDKAPAGDASLPTQSNWRIDGYIRSTQGRPVIWVNGKADNNNVELRSDDDQVIVRINDTITRRLAPGQSTSAIEFGERNSVVIHRGAVPIDGADQHRSMKRVIPTHPK